MNTWHVLLPRFLALSRFHTLHQENGTTHIMQRIEQSNERRLVHQSTKQNRHRLILRIAFVLDRHPTAIIGPALLQDSLDADPVDCRLYQTGLWIVIHHGLFLR